MCGKGFQGRVLSSDKEIETISGYMTTLALTKPSSPLHLCIIPAKTEKYGIYIDLDPVLRTTEKIIDPLVHTKSEQLKEIVIEFIKLYISNLAKAHLSADATTTGTSRKAGMDVEKSFEFCALYAPRPRLEEKGKDGDYYLYKHGCHVYIGEIQASQSEHLIAFNAAKRAIHSTSYDERPLVKLMMDAYDMKRSEVADVFDENINASRNILLPGCRKADGHVNYHPTTVIKFILTIIPSGDDGRHYIPHVACSNPKGVPWESAIGLRRFFPIYPGRETFVINSVYDPATVPMPDVPPPTKEDLDELDEEGLIGEAEMIGNDQIPLIMHLLKIIPFDKIADKSSGHGFRLNVVNAVTHEIKLTEEDRHGWAIRIIRWAFNRGRVPEGAEWNIQSHIEGKVREAEESGQKSGLDWLKREASAIDPYGVSAADTRYNTRGVTRFLEDLHRRHRAIGIERRSSAINHQEAAALFYKILGENYKSFPGSGSRDRIWYHYSERTDPHFSTKKWQRLPNVKEMIMHDIETIINPLLDQIGRGGRVQDPTARIPFPQYIAEVRDTLGGNNFIEGMVQALASKYVLTGCEFASDLDMRPDLTGCLNGILRFEANPFKVTLLDGNNRSIPVSRSLDARWRTDFSDETPSVKRVFQIFSQIVPVKQELDYILTVAAGIILSGRCSSEKFFILYGCGGDGKTTLMNGLISLAGRNVSGRYPGYGAEGDPRIFQCEKRDANSHDGGSYHLYGGPRIGNFPEPNSEHPYLIESAIKSKLSGSAQSTRDLHQSSQTLEFRIVPFLLTNGQLEFRGTITVGGQRRISCMLFSEKFKPEEEMSQYRNKRGIHAMDPSAVKAFEHEDGREMREALLWILVTKYLPIFYDQYKADICSIPLPIRYKKITANFFGRHADIMSAFVTEKMVRMNQEEEGYRSMIALNEFINVFTLWHRTTQRGTIGDLSTRKSTKGKQDTDGPVMLDPWTHEVLHILSSSLLGTDVIEKIPLAAVESDAPSTSIAAPSVSRTDFRIEGVGPNEIPMRNSSRLYIDGWAWKDHPKQTAAPSASMELSSLLQSEGKRATGEAEKK